MIATGVAPVPLVDSSDRTAWLSVRRTGATATEVRDVMTGKKTPRQIAEEKIAGFAVDLSRNQYVQWGNVREAVIAAELERRYGLVPSGVVYARGDNRRHLATPDGVPGAAMNDVIAEIKTSKHDLTIGGRAFEAAGYGWQMDWQIYVMDVAECAFAWERHFDDWGDFDALDPEGTMHLGPTTQPIQVEWWPRDDARIERLIAVADQITGWVDALSEGREFEGAPALDETIDTHAVNYLRGLAAEKEGAALKTASDKAIRALMTDEAFVQVGPFARVSWQEKKVEEVVTSKVPADDELPPEVLAEVVRLRALTEKHQGNAVRSGGKLAALLASHAKKVTTTVPVARRPYITAVKDKTTKEKKA